MRTFYDTIAAVATAPGLGGIGIVRISGPLAIAIITPLFTTPPSRRGGPPKVASGKPSSFQHRQLHYGHIVDPESQQVVDEVLIAFMQAPNSYTREDVVEVQSHAGSAILQKILSLVIAGGARLAEPGEFTRRAFLQGRIDLTQAEAVADLINARTQEAMNIAARQLTGGMRQRVGQIRKRLKKAAGHLEAMIEFPEEVTDDSDPVSDFAGAAKTALSGIEALMRAFQESHIYRDGIQVSVVGRPNVGKSSLLNALLERERAIVTELPGTTRDLVIDSFQVDGIPIQIADTAGMRSSENIIEQIGIRKTEESIAAAQLVLFVVDAKAGYGLEDEMIYQQLENKTTLLVINKADLVEGDAQPPEWKRANMPYTVISAKYRQNIERLKKQMVALITRGAIGPPPDHIVPNIRQKTALEKAAQDISNAMLSFQSGESEEFIVFHLQSALNSLGTITGESHTEDLLDLIFDRFCIGK
jgi:tRNA modification GTPase